MYERFTDRARRVLAFANQTAQEWNYEYIGTEQIIVGLNKEGAGVGYTILKEYEIDLNVVVAKIIESRTILPNMVTMGQLPITREAEQVIHSAIAFSKKMGQNYVGTEHIVYGLLEEKNGVGASLLTESCLTCEVYEKRLKMLDSSFSETDPQQSCISCISYEVCGIAKHIQKTPLLNICSNLNDARAQMFQVVGKCCKLYYEVKNEV